ncbi:hypothetical protein K438DRAFT_1944184 [Mycena galopus ATCC 62051]|nr:hypothetical protein K438DRAFT_1944184 [Mycena galopus ATCC 62051]
MSVLPAVVPRPMQLALASLAPSRTKVHIFHPFLPDSPILEFYAYPEQETQAVGVPIGSVLDACIIVAMNRSGELQRNTAPYERVAGPDSDPDTLLVPGMYRFIIVENGQFDLTYPIHQSFEDWIPPVMLPNRWMGNQPAADDANLPDLTDVNGAVKADDKKCILTGATTALDASNLIPHKYKDWVIANFMKIEAYGGSASADVDSARNEIALRGDLNQDVFDRGLFVLVPYADQIISLFVLNSGRDLAQLYHLRAVDFPSRVLRGYLYLRYGWSVINFLLIPGSAKALMKKIQDPETAKGPKDKLKRKRVGRGQGGGRNHSAGSNEENSVMTPEEIDEQRLINFKMWDESLKGRPLTRDDDEAGRYVGFSSIKETAMKYRRAHPEISAVGSTMFWEGDNDECIA